VRYGRAGLALGGALLTLAAGCVGPVASLYPPAPHRPAEPVWIVDHGWHTGLVIERASIPAGLLPEQDDFPGAAFLEVGWGDADFYRAREPGLGAALRAAVASRASVIHVLGLRVPPEEVFAARDVVEVRLSRPGFEALVRFVHDGFDRHGRRVTPALGDGPSGAGLFYPSRERYNLLNTCNTWVARALRAAGAPITPAYALTAGNLMWQVRRLPSVVDGATAGVTRTRIVARVGEQAHRVRRRSSRVRRAPRPRWRSIRGDRPPAAGGRCETGTSGRRAP
jgi:uncharacterized protein (TIGR02117 family)